MNSYGYYDVASEAAMKISKNVLLSIFLEEARHILKDEKSAQEAARDTLEWFISLHPDMVK